MERYCTSEERSHHYHLFISLRNTVDVLAFHQFLMCIMTAMCQ